MKLFFNTLLLINSAINIVGCADDQDYFLNVAIDQISWYVEMVNHEAKNQYIKNENLRKKVMLKEFQNLLKWSYEGLDLAKLELTGENFRY